MYKRPQDLSTSEREQLWDYIRENPDMSAAVIGENMWTLKLKHRFRMNGQSVGIERKRCFAQNGNGHAGGLPLVSRPKNPTEQEETALAALAHEATDLLARPPAENGFPSITCTDSAGTHVIDATNVFELSQQLADTTLPIALNKAIQRMTALATELRDTKEVLSEALERLMDAKNDLSFSHDCLNDIMTASMRGLGVLPMPEPEPEASGRKKK
jgi:hypothetical protein